MVHEGVPLVVERQKLQTASSVVHLVAGGDDLLALAAHDRQQLGHVVRADRVGQGLHGVVG